jgi:hypothetical protein
MVTYDCETVELCMELINIWIILTIIETTTYDNASHFVSFVFEDLVSRTKRRRRKALIYFFTTIVDTFSANSFKSTS